MKHLSKKLLFSTILPIMLYGDMTPKEVLVGNCLKNYENGYQTYKNHKAFFYARDKSGKDICNWSYGYDNRQKAIAVALKGCQKAKLESECILVDVDGTFDVKDGSFKRIEPLDTAPLTKEKKEQLIKEAKNILLGNCLPFFKDKYLPLKGYHKAFGYAVDSNGNYACGYGTSFIDKESAKKLSLKQCNINKNKRSKNAPMSSCKIYAVANKIVSNADAYGVKVEKKSDRFLDSDEYNGYLEKGKEIIVDSGCLLEYKYYLRGTEQMAYYLTKAQGDKQACGKKEDALSMDIALKEAKKSCQQMAKKKGINTECKLIAKNFEFVGKKSDFEAKESIEDFKKSIHKGDLKRVKSYISKGYDVSTKSDKDGITPLFIAAAKGDKDFFLQLIKKGANIKHIAKDNSTLLHASVMGGNKEIVKYLLDKGLDINAKGFEGNTPLHLSSMMMKDSISKLLIEAGANQNIKNDKNQRAGAAFRELEEKITKMIKNEFHKENYKNEQQGKDLTKPTSLKNAIALAVKAMSKNLPMKIDDEMQLTRVSAKGNRMILGYTLTNLSSKDISANELKSLVYEDIKKEVCSDNETVTMLKKGMIAEYTYQGKNNRHITDFSFDAKACGVKSNARQLMENVKKLLHKK